MHTGTVMPAMSAKKRVILHKAFVTLSDKTFEDADGSSRNYQVAHMPKGLVVNGTPVGGATFTARYSYPADGNPDYLVFSFKEGALVNLSVPVRGRDGSIEAFAKIGVTPDDLTAALAEQRESFRARLYARSRDGLRAPDTEGIEPARYRDADEARLAIKDAVDRFRDKGRRCTMRDLYTVLVSLAGSWEDITRNQGGTAQEQERDLPDLQREMDDPYDLTEYAMDDMRADGCAREHR